MGWPHRTHNRETPMRPYLPAVILIVIGVMFLLQNLGIAGINFGRLIATWWPLILIAVGLSMLFKRSSPRK
jgi:Domain of unknown function (DUF5668)